jgi:hypothetical protein
MLFYYCFFQATPTPGTPSTTATSVTPTPSYAVMPNRGTAANPTPLVPPSDVTPENTNLSESTLDLKRELEVS